MLLDVTDLNALVVGPKFPCDIYNFACSIGLYDASRAGAHEHVGRTRPLLVGHWIRH